VAAIDACGDAKGVEDTMFYCFDRLVSEMRWDRRPRWWEFRPNKFHEFCHYLSERGRTNMLATSTHDNKRSEDVRARISILSEIPERWSEALHQWSQLNAMPGRIASPTGMPNISCTRR